MKKISFNISDDIFSKFPDYCRGVLFIKNAKNGDSPQELIQQIREQESNIRGGFSIEGLLKDERINSWREAYRKAGIKPSEFRCSIEAMLRRVLKDQPLHAINMLVDIGNYLSLKHFVPIGCHSLDDVNSGMELKLASGNEQFIPFGGSEADNPPAGEIIFTDDREVMTRRWTWRQSNHTIITRNTASVEYNIDGLPPTDKDKVKAIGAELIKLCGEYFSFTDPLFTVIDKNKTETTYEV